MKRFLIVLATAFAGLLTLSYFTNLASSNSSGSPGNRTGSPGDNNTTCRSCHIGTTVVPKNDVITTNIPETGYIPGASYTVTVTFSRPGRTRFGFEMTSENNAGQTKGKFALSNSETRLLSGGSGITHSASGTSAASGTRTWTANWIAPVAGSGKVTFFAAINAADGNGSTNGDEIYTTSLAVNENQGSSVLEGSAPEIFSVYPVPCLDQLTVSPGSGLFTSGEAVIYTPEGRQIATYPIPAMGASRLEVAGLPAGVYLIRTEINGKPVTARFIKNL